jgi:RNA polymerase sigma-70 factor (ECF subfamily)
MKSAMPSRKAERWGDLAQRLRAGDAASETELARLFYPHLMAMAAGRLSDREAAREIVQEALLAVLSALRDGRLREPEKLPAFVVGTGRNLINNYLRKRTQRPDPITLGGEEASLPDPDGDADDPIYEKTEEKDLVLGALQELKALDRGILFLTLAEGLNPREIALEMGLKPETVRLRKSRALRRLRRKLRKVIRKRRPDY